MDPTNDMVKPFRVVKADDLGIHGTVLEEIIRNGRCIICGDIADREIWCYEKQGEERTNKVGKKNFACSPECAEAIAWRS